MWFFEIDLPIIPNFFSMIIFGELLQTGLLSGGSNQRDASWVCPFTKGSQPMGPDESYSEVNPPDI